MEIAIKRKVASEWDGGWFCDECKNLHHWKEDAYVVEGKKYCKNCLTNKYKNVIIYSESKEDTNGH